MSRAVFSRGGGVRASWCTREGPFTVYPPRLPQSPGWPPSSAWVSSWFPSPQAPSPPGRRFPKWTEERLPRPSWEKVSPSGAQERLTQGPLGLAGGSSSGGRRLCLPWELPFRVDAEMEAQLMGLRAPPSLPSVVPTPFPAGPRPIAVEWPASSPPICTPLLSGQIGRAHV